jgi:hypothetical protein
MTRSTENLKICDLEDADKSRWDTFVLAHDDATFFHRAGWADVIQSLI